MPAGSELTLCDIDWNEYEAILDQMEPWPGHRVTYENGRIAIMSPRQDHEMYSELIQDMARLLSINLDVDVESRGTTTFKRKALMFGVEPDTCFYVKSAQLIIEAPNEPDLTPVPDVVVEVDLRSSSIDKFPIYAELGVRELWRYDGSRAKFYELRDSTYQEIETSIAFPQLPSEIVTSILEESKSGGQTAALRSFTKWIEDLRSV
jgi:Uma2 family endonuclease